MYEKAAPSRKTIQTTPPEYEAAPISSSSSSSGKGGRVSWEDAISSKHMLVFSYDWTHSNDGKISQVITAASCLFSGLCDQRAALGRPRSIPFIQCLAPEGALCATSTLSCLEKKIK